MQKDRPKSRESCWVSFFIRKDVLRMLDARARLMGMSRSAYLRLIVYRELGVGRSRIDAT